MCNGFYEVVLFENSKKNSSKLKLQQQKKETLFVIISVIVVITVSFAMGFLFAFINNNYFTVLVYTFLLAMLFSDGLYKEYVEHPQNKKDAFYNGILLCASKCKWLYLPAKPIMYFLSLIFLVVSHMEELKIIDLNVFWNEFIGLHDKTILILIGVDSIMSNLFQDASRLKILLNTYISRKCKK